MADYNKSINETGELGENRLKGQIKVEKKSLSKRIVDFLFSDKIDNIGYYLKYEILGPTLRDLLFKSITGATGMAIYGSVRDFRGPTQQRPMANQSYPGGPFPYNQMAQGGMYGGQFYAQTSAAAQYNGQYGSMGLGLSDISFTTKDDALYQLDRLGTMIAKYGKVRVKDFYQDVGYTPPPGNWAIDGAGWYNLEGAHPIPTSNGRWIIEFPPPVAIR